jgi:hypothetical protein
MPVEEEEVIDGVGICNLLPVVVVVVGVIAGVFFGMTNLPFGVGAGTFLIPPRLPLLPVLAGGFLFGVAVVPLTGIRKGEDFIVAPAAPAAAVDVVVDGILVWNCSFPTRVELLLANGAGGALVTGRGGVFGRLVGGVPPESSWSVSKLKKLLAPVMLGKEVAGV